MEKAFKPAINMADNKQKPSFKSPRELKNNTQKTAFQLLQREEVNAKKSRLECLLAQQFTGKYGSKNPKSEVNQFIKKTVKDFVNSYESVLQAEAMISSLESQIKNIVTSMKLAKKAKQETDNMEIQSQNEGNSSQTNFKRSSSAPKTKQIDENQWPVINAILALSDEQRHQQEEKALQAKKLKFQHDLNRQIEENKRKALIAEEEKNRALQINKKNLAEYEQEVNVLRHRKEDNFKSERTMRMIQIEENKQQRDKEREIRIAQEQAEMARARRLAEQEEEAKRVKKEQQKRAQDLLFVENERNKALKAEALRERQEYEVKLNKDYEIKLEKEEHARAHAFQTRMEALSNIANNYESRVGAKLKQEAADNERNIHLALKEKERQDMERERLKVETRRQQSLQSAEYNISMMEQKRKEKEREKMESLERRLRLEQEVAEQKRKDREAADTKKLKMHEMRANLDKQVSLKNSARGRELTGLSDIEQNMNKSIIKKLNEDPNMLGRVMERVNPAPARHHASQSSGNNIF